jgi:hypothetical protein
MSDSSENDSLHHPGPDYASDSESSAALACDQSESRKNPRQSTQIQGKAWVFHGYITTDQLPIRQGLWKVVLKMKAYTRN